MLKVLRMIFRRAPLLVLIILIWIILSVLSIAGRGKAYRSYASEDKFAPGISIFMRGLHDHVLPWSDAKSTGKNKNPAEEPEDSVDTEKTRLASGEEDLPDGNEKDSEKDSDSKKDVREHSSGEESGEKTGEDGTVKEDSVKEDSVKEDSVKKDSEKEDSAKKESSKNDTQGEDQEVEDQEKEAKEKESSGADPDSADSSKKDGDQSPDGKEAARSDTQTQKVPARSSTPVVMAKDYGVAQKSYLSPEDTVYNKDTEGLFAPDGTYYSFQKVEDSYFVDALFVGDSRTVGLYEYGGMADTASFLARESTTIYDLFDENEKMDYAARGKKATERTFKGLLSKTDFGKIYLSVGVNELGVPDTKDFYEEYRRVIRRINKLQPDAIIYIQGIMHVSKDKSSSDPVYNNTAIVQRNQAIATLANGRNIFYIDMNADLCDEDGNLKKELTGDGIHLKASACELWHKFLCKNAIVLPAAEKAKEDKKTTEASSKKEEAEKAEKEASEKDTSEKNTSGKE